MWTLFKRKRENAEDEYVSIWKSDFSDCVAADYLPNYSVCQNENNVHCRYVIHYSGMVLCSHPEHKRFIPADAEPFDPTRRQFPR